MIDDLGTVDVGRDPTGIGTQLEALRVFVGYAGWAPGQLEGELEQGAWFVVDAHAVRSVRAVPDGAVDATCCAGSAAGIAIFATCPADPSVN